VTINQEPPSKAKRGRPRSPEPPKSAAQRQADYKAKLDERGLVTVKVIVHANDADAIRDTARAMRAQRGIQLPGEGPEVEANKE